HEPPTTLASAAPASPGARGSAGASARPEAVFRKLRRFNPLGFMISLFVVSTGGSLLFNDGGAPHGALPPGSSGQHPGCVGCIGAFSIRRYLRNIGGN